MAAKDRTLLAKLGFADPDRKNPRHDRACNYLAQRPDALAATLRGAFGEPVEVLKSSATIEVPVSKGEGHYKTSVGFVDVVAECDVCRRIPVRRPVQPPRDFEDGFDARLDRSIAAHPVWGKHLPDGQAARSRLPDEWLSEYGRWYVEEARRLIDEARPFDKTERSRYEKDCTEARKTELLAVGAQARVLIEVKISPVSSGDLIRQIGIYREFAQWFAYSTGIQRPQAWDLATGAEYEALKELADGYAKRLRSDCTTRAVAVLDYAIDTDYLAACQAARIHVVRLGDGFERFLKEQTATEVPGV